MPVESVLPYRNPQLPIEQRVSDLLARMTLEEKLAQMTVLGQIDAVVAGTANLDQLSDFAAKGAGAVSRLGLKNSPVDTVLLYNKIQHYLVEQTRLGIPAFAIDEALHGLMAQGSTSFPQAIGLASTWNPDLVCEVFTAIAAEMRARGGNYALTPVLDLARDPRWGRTEETYGEDPYLVSRLGVAAIRGLQGDQSPIDPQHVIATAKHFAAHGQPEGGRNTAPANYAERDLREFFLAPFEAAVREARVQSVMASYNEINGIPVHVNHWVLHDVLRDEWGFDGFITSDGGGIRQLVSEHHVAADKAEAARKVLQAGIDFELDTCFGALLQQVRDGVVPEALIDTAVARVLRAKFRLGLFEQPCVDPHHAGQITNCADHRALALQAAHQAIVLLKNEGQLLPLDRATLKSIAVIGPNAAIAHLGGYSAEPAYSVSVLDGVRRKVGDAVQVVYAEGCRIIEDDQGWQGWWLDQVVPGDPIEDEARLAEAVAVARSADVALVVVGENEATCREAWSENHLGDRDSLDLLGRQDDLVKAIVATGTPTIVLLINGRPLSINWIAEHVPAILEGWYLGQETGTAVADVLFGDVNPGGKLPITFPRSVGQIPAYYYRKPSAQRSYLFSQPGPLFPFGYGLSYTSFEYRDLRVTPSQIKPAGKAVASVRVVNTGSRTGDEVVQLYVHDQISTVTRPVKLLTGFQRITLAPGKDQTIEFEIAADQLSLLNEQMERIVEPGVFDLMIGGSSEQVQTIPLEVIA
ncbi:MAG TPA: glycoside hydrolase family 3 N-terminal domain-containing protein [Anaerolineae bacterium]|nr:glycoside hydrolase family 3 N-terminal domain-containing protein [Anaerolineae bacterium]